MNEMPLNAIELIHNCQHGSEIAVYSVREGSRKFIRKSTATPGGIEDLTREAAGWSWYQARRYPQRTVPICLQLGRGAYHRIDVEWIEGKKGDFRKGLFPNREIIQLAFEQYCSLWPEANDGTVPLHGDFSIDNLIFNEEGIHVIDWEHFKERGAPWGFDPIYLLYEALWFSTGRRRHPSRKEVTTIATFLKQLYKAGRLEESLVVRPLRTIRTFIQDHKEIWGEQLRRFPEKLLVVKFSDEQVADIDRMVHQALDSTA